MPLIVLTILSLACQAAESAKEAAPASVPELEKTVAGLLQKHRTPGAAVALVNRQGVLWAAGIGKADLTSGRPATAATLFRIGSISKGFAAVSVMMLVEEGKLSLDTPLKSVAPEIAFVNRWEATDPVRVVHLLEHTAGWDDLALSEYANSDPTPLTLRDGFAFRPASRTCRWPPGSGFSYCNSGPAAAAYVVEKVSGRRFEDFVSERIFQPLGMKTATYFYPADAANRLAVGYEEDTTNLVPYWHILMRPAGAINASAAEMGEYVRLYLNRGSVNGKALLKPSSIDRIETPGSSRAARLGVKGGYGLCTATTFYKGFVFHGHNGGMDGYLAEMGYLRDEGLGYAFMINSGSHEAVSAISKAIRAYLTRELPEPTPPAAGSVRLDAFAGYYEPQNPRNEWLHFLDRLLDVIRVRVEGGTLSSVRLLSSSRRKLIPVSGAQFRPDDSPIADRVFTQDETGAPIMVITGAVFRRIPAWRMWGRLAIGAISLALLLSSILLALIWILTRLLRKQGRPLHLGLRLWPLAAGLSAAGFALFLADDSPGLIWRLGRPTLYSVTLCAVTLLLPLTSLAGLIWAIRSRAGAPRALWIYSLACLLAGCIISAYLASYGWIAVRPWR